MTPLMDALDLVACFLFSSNPACAGHVRHHGRGQATELAGRWADRRGGGRLDVVAAWSALVVAKRAAHLE
ncbi:hypothetical protein [Xanthomonas maliensis]|uniref:hypothetical protein n=1 Tax=Xanthomonas maliensis TaxID=1321368 RepID=UPI0012642FDE|nr:hypothetical protein [Xanthomonas maliensis]